MTTKCKYENIKIKTKKQWEVPRGHTKHITGSGAHGGLTRRLRTRANKQRFFLGEYYE